MYDQGDSRWNIKGDRSNIEENLNTNRRVVKMEIEIIPLPLIVGGEGGSGGECLLGTTLTSLNFVMKIL